ncbi:unnamed protein product [Coffea canephora]|uniref:DUF7780 domain-containing protein n=1 Tax=Coffea canephora TaxID=49390 RepID=A0A068V000_COFCA|nr:unnamed protein product [Coffea canephora]
MGFPAKAKTTSSTGTGSDHRNWGMGFLFILFPEDEDSNNNDSASAASSIINKKRHQNVFNPFSSSSNSSSSSSLPLPIFRRSNSSHLLSRAQSTISICALLFFITFLLFTLSTFEPSSHFTPRRQLSQFSSSTVSGKYSNDYNKKFKKSSASDPSLPHALQGMGTLYRRGTKAMNDLVVAHVSESLSLHELKLFLRLLYKSSLTSRADLLFIFPSKSASFDSAILEENDSFSQLVDHYKKLNSTQNLSLAQFVKSSKKDKQSGEPIWGRRIRSNFSGGNETESTRLSYGSVVSFDVDELDPENSLAGFLDHVPMSLRRWACYPMLLGRVRRNFKHIVLVDAKELLLTGDPLSRVRSASPESVYLSMVTQTVSTRHGKKNSEKTQVSVNPAIIRGGARGVRRLSSAMLTEIARAAMQRKKKNPVTEWGLFNRLVGNEFLLKNVNLIKSTE